MMLWTKGSVQLAKPRQCSYCFLAQGSKHTIVHIAHVEGFDYGSVLLTILWLDNEVLLGKSYGISMFGSQAVRDASELYELHIALHSLTILFHIDLLGCDCSKDIFYFRILFESRPSIVQNMLRQQLRDCLCSLLVLCGSPFIFTLQCPHIAFMSSNCERISSCWNISSYIYIYIYKHT